MCNYAVCGQHPGEVEFRAYRQTLHPDEVIFGREEQMKQVRYGVMLNAAVCQWEIVAVEANKKRHVAFVSPQCRLDQVLDLAGRWARSMTAMSRQAA